MDINELISIRNGDKAAYAELLERFEPLIKREVSDCVRKLPAESDADPEEFRSEAMLALYKAALSYEDGKRVTFGLYAKICIHNRLISCVRKISAQRRKREREERRGHYRDGRSKSAEDSLIDQADSEEVRRMLERETSAYERKIFTMYLEKKSYAEISDETGRDVKSVGNAIYRVKRKLRKLIAAN